MNSKGFSYLKSDWVTISESMVAVRPRFWHRIRGEKRKGQEEESCGNCGIWGKTGLKLIKN